MKQNLFDQTGFLFLVQKGNDVKEETEEFQKNLTSSWDKLWARMETWRGNFIEHLPEILIALAVFIACYLLSIYVKRFLYKHLTNTIKRTSIRSLIANMASIFLIMTGLMIAISILNLGNMFNGLLAAGGIAGLTLGLALQGTLTNTFSGIFLSLNDMMNVGDWVETNGYTGEVVEINLRNTRIREPDNNLVVIPNQTIIENPFKNFGLTARIRTTVKCGVEYTANLREVKELVQEVVAKHYPPRSYESIEFHWLEFGDSSINFQVRFWIEAKKRLAIYEANSEAIMLIKEAFDQRGINIPFPIRTLQFKKDSKLKIDTDKDSPKE